jgi:predicted enzyme related to lactoylglutathione lyase
MASDTHGKFIWCELMTTDTKAAAGFYSSVIGWTTKEMPMEDLPSPYTIFEADGRGVAGMMTFPAELEGQGIPPNWTGYVCVDDVDQSAKDFEANGGQIRRPPEDIPTIGRFAVVADPHGAVLCIMTPLPMEGDSGWEPEMGTPGHIGWHELMAGNMEEAFAFYSKVFAEHGKQIGGMMTKPAGVPMCYWGYYFNVPAIDSAIERVNAGGGKVIVGPMEVPGGSWIINATDPQGAYFCLVAPGR